MLPITFLVTNQNKGIYSRSRYEYSHNIFYRCTNILYGGSKFFIVETIKSISFYNYDSFLHRSSHSVKPSFQYYTIDLHPIMNASLQIAEADTIYFLGCVKRDMLSMRKITFFLSMWAFCVYVDRLECNGLYEDEDFIIFVLRISKLGI